MPGSIAPACGARSAKNAGFSRPILPHGAERPPSPARQRRVLPLAARLHLKLSLLTSAVVSLLPPVALAVTPREEIAATAQAVLKEYVQGWQDETRIELKPESIPADLPLCQVMNAEVAAEANQRGRVAVIVSCLQPNRWSVQIPATLQRFGTVIVTSRPIRQNETLTGNDVAEQYAELTSLPDDVVRNTHDAIGRQLRVSVTAQQPLRQSWLVLPIVIPNGATVKVLLAGEGFRIETQGKAMQAARQGERVRVRLDNGRILTGLAWEDGSVWVEP